MKTIIGKNNIQEQIPEILHDESRYTLGIPERVYFPENINDLRFIVAEANKYTTPLTLIGGQTGITGGAVSIDGCFAVSFAAMNSIRKVLPQEQKPHVLLVEPGITIFEIKQFLESPLSWPEQVEGVPRLDNSTWFYPPDPTEMTAQLGGTVATNASGARSFRYGPTRNHITQLSIVLANGETVTLHRGTTYRISEGCTIVTDQGTPITIPPVHYASPSVKNAAGYYSHESMECIDLFIGSEGTLGIISEIGIQLSPAPSFVAGLSFFPSPSHAFDFADFLRTETPVSAIEYFDESTLQFVDNNRERIPHRLSPFPERGGAIYWEYDETLEMPFESKTEAWESKLVQCGSSFDATWSGFDAQEIGQLKQFRHTIPELINATVAHYKLRTPSIRKIGTDTALPSFLFRALYFSSISEIRDHAIPFAAFGHLGDYHIHINMLPRNKQELTTALDIYSRIMTRTIKNGGTVSAEHGIGKIKRNYLLKMYGPDGIDEMRAIKSALDPKWLLNPGNLFEAPRSDGNRQGDHPANRKYS